MQTTRTAELVALMARQWHLIGIAGLMGSVAMCFSARLVSAYLIAEQRHFYGPLEPFSFLRQYYIVVSVALLAFGVLCLVCSRGLSHRSRRSRTALIFTCWLALAGSVAFGGLCFLAALNFGGLTDHPGLISSGAYLVASAGFYSSCIWLLSSRSVKAYFQGGQYSAKQPNNGVQRTETAPSLRTRQSILALRGLGR